MIVTLIPLTALPLESRIFPDVPLTLTFFGSVVVMFALLVIGGVGFGVTFGVGLTAGVGFGERVADGLGV